MERKLLNKLVIYLLILLIFYALWVFCLNVWLCSMCIPGAQQGPEEIPWGRSCIEMVVSFHVCMLRSNLEPLEGQPVLLVT